MTHAIVEHLGIETEAEDDLNELRQDTEPDVILNAVEKGRDGSRS